MGRPGTCPARAARGHPQQPELHGQVSPHRCPPSPHQGRQLETVRAEVAEKGDVGLVAESSRSTQRLMLPPPPLTTSGVFAKFRDIARLTGSAVSGTGWLTRCQDIRASRAQQAAGRLLLLESRTEEMLLGGEGGGEGRTARGHAEGRWGWRGEEVGSRDH